MTRPSACAVAAIIAEQLDVAVDDVVPTARLFGDLRAMPLALVRASLALEDAFGISISDAALASVTTVEDFMALVARSRGTARASSASGRPLLPPSEVTLPGGRARARSPRRMRRGRWR